MSGPASAAVESLAAGLLEVLALNLIGLYVHGSLVSGAFVPDRSDLDLLAVVNRDLDDSEADALLMLFESNPFAHDFEIDFRAVTTVVAAEPSAAGWKPTLAFEIEIRPWSGGRARPRRGPVDEPDLVIELSQVRERSHTLFGPDASTVVGPVPAERVVEVGDGHLAMWQDLPFNPDVAELMVFTACRAWRFAVTGTHTSKDDAANWVLSRRPDLDVVAEALAIRHGAEGVIEAEPVFALLRIAREEIARRRM
ncbi:MAG: hypothetical protein QOK43_2186 [Acidimicrobiaceae bacterium]|nr:hypothetical protein [Acidimicrobiaceae bacterium]